MLPVIVSIIFFGMIVIQIFLSFRVYKLKKQLEEKSFFVSNWSTYSAIKDLKEIVNTSNDKMAKEIASKIINLRLIAPLLFIISVSLIFLVFFFNGIFNLGL